MLKKLTLLAALCTLIACDKKNHPHDALLAKELTTLSPVTWSAPAESALIEANPATYPSLILSKEHTFFALDPVIEAARIKQGLEALRREETPHHAFLIEEEALAQRVQRLTPLAQLSEQLDAPPESTPLHVVVAPDVEATRLAQLVEAAHQAGWSTLTLALQSKDGASVALRVTRPEPCPELEKEEALHELAQRCDMCEASKDAVQQMSGRCMMLTVGVGTTRHWGAVRPAEQAEAVCLTRTPREGAWDLGDTLVRVSDAAPSCQREEALATLIERARAQEGDLCDHLEVSAEAGVTVQAMVEALARGVEAAPRQVQSVDLSKAQPPEQACPTP